MPLHGAMTYACQLNNGKIMSSSTLPAASYDRDAIAFHWTIAVMICFLAAVGLRLDSMPNADKAYWVNMHVCFGLVFFLLVIGRLVWRIGHKPPPLPSSIDAFTRKTSTGVHHLMYALILVIPMVGFVALAWHGRGFDFGLFKISPGIASNKVIYPVAEDVHGMLVYLLLALAALHAAAAVWHQFIRKDGLISRMLP